MTFCVHVFTCENKDDEADWLKVTIEIVDVNDNAPAFPHSYSTVYISEATLPGQLLFPIQPAYDVDSPQYGVVGYRLVEEEV